MKVGTDKIIESVQDYVELLAADRGLEMVDVQFRREGHGWVLRVFIDREEGVTIDDCAGVSRAISAWLDVEDLIEYAYHLEVSSPGLERPLKKREDFERFCGRNARIKLQEPLNGQLVFTGILERVEVDLVVLVVDAHPVSLHFTDIARARLTL